MNLGLGSTLLPGDPRLIDHIVGEVKSQGIFDQFRKECIADVDTKPAYQNLRTRVESSVNSFLSKQRWRADLNKNQLRETLRKHISDAPYLDTGVERIVAQVVNPKIYSVFMPQVEDVVYKFLGLEKPVREKNGACGFKDLLPKDLDPVSPESDKNSLKDVSLDSVDANLTVPGEEEPGEEQRMKLELEEPEVKEEIKTDENSQAESEFGNGKIDEDAVKSMDEPMDLEGSTPPPPPGVDDPIETIEKVAAVEVEEEEEEEEEEDSPVFEPIDIMNLNESNVSNDSHLSGISELTSHRSRSPDFSNEFSRDNFDFSNQDSQLSKVSSDSRLSIVTDFGYSNQPTTPISDVIKDDNSKEKFIKDNFKEIRDESDKIKEIKTVDINKQRDIPLDNKDSDTRSSRTNLSSKESSRDGTECIRDKSEHREREKYRDSIKPKGSKERSDSRDSRSHKDRDKRKSNQSEGKSENSDKSKAKDKPENPKESAEKIRDNKESKESKESPSKTKEEKPKESSGREGKDLKDIYKEKIRELREKKELTEKEKMNKDNKESKEPSKDSKVSKDSKDKRESSKNKDKHRSSSSSSRNRSSSRHESKSARSSKEDSKSSRSESKDKSKRDDRRHSKDGKSRSQLESTEKSGAKKVSKPEKTEKLENKQDSKSRDKSSKKESKSESHRSTEKSDKRDDSREKKRKEEKKSKTKDDHSSLRKNSNDRRSSDRDGSSGSNGRGSTKSSSSSTASSKPSSTPLEKESSNASNSSSETSDSIDESQTEDNRINEIKEEKTETIFENINELPDDNSNPKRIDLGPTEISLPLKKRPLQNDESTLFKNEVTIKKPKFARNFEEAKKLMKLRKKLEKLKDQSSGDSKSPLPSEISEISEAENDGISSVPDDERVQIIAVNDEEEDVPYPGMQCNFITDDTSKIILGDTELLSKEMIAKLNAKSALSEMELAIRQSLNEMISGKNLEDNAPHSVAPSDSDRRPSISQEEACNDSTDAQPRTSASDDIPEQPQTRVEGEEEKMKEDFKENRSIEKQPFDTSLEQRVEEKETEQSITTEELGATATTSSPKNPQLSEEEEEDCLYFLPNYERLNRFTQFLNSMNEGEASSILPQPIEKMPPELKRSEINTMAPPQPKRKYSTSPLSDILLNNSNNNNDGPKIEATIYEEDGQTAGKRKKMGRPKKLRPSVSSSSLKNVINGENFVMPLSPESDASVTSEKNQITQSNDKNRSRGSNQRYNSDDLYKPRPLFASSSRRSRKSNPS